MRMPVLTMGRLLAVLLVGLLTGGARGTESAQFDVAVRGRPAELTVILPVKASASQRYAAEELVRFVERMTGVRLPMADDSASKPARAILLGATRFGTAAADELESLGPDGFRLRVIGDDLEILGSPVRGTLYGVYELLEKYGGCRWYSSWCEKVPRLARFGVPTNLDDRQVPAFPHREPFWYDMFNGDFAARNKANGPSMRVGAKHGGPAGRFGGGLGNCHTFQTLLPSARYGKEHPEYFALRDGKRLVAEPGQTDDFVTQPCLTNPNVLRIVTSNVLARIRQDPGATYYGVSQNDNSKFCTCPSCAAVDAAEGSHAGTMVRFVNAVADAVAREFPDKIIEFLAYRYTRRPPKLTKLRDNVMPCLCSIECDFSRPLDESKFPDNVAFVADMKGWAAQARRLYVWDYVTDFHNYPTPHPNVYALQGNVRFMRDHKVMAYFTQGDRQGSHAGFADLKAWLLAKWMWNPELPMKDLLDDFFAGCYGPAAPAVRAYFEKLHRLELDYTAQSPEHALYCEPTGRNQGIPDAFWREADGLMEQAVAAAGNAAPYADNVRVARFGVDYALLSAMQDGPGMAVVNLTGETDTARALETYVPAARRALAFTKDHPTARLCSSLPRQTMIYANWRRAAQGSGAVRTDGILEDEYIGINTERPVRRVADGQAGDGHAVRFADPCPRWSSMTPLACVAFKSGVRYRLAVRVRAEVDSGRKGTVLTAGVHDPSLRRSFVCLSVPAERAADGYLWLFSESFAPAELSPSAYIFLGDGYVAPDGQPVAKAVYVDSLKFVPVVDVERRAAR